MQHLPIIIMFVILSYLFVKWKINAQQTTSQEQTFADIHKGTIKNLHDYWKIKMDNATTIDDKVDCLMAATKASEVVNELMGFDTLSRQQAPVADAVALPEVTPVPDNVVPLHRQ